MKIIRPIFKKLYNQIKSGRIIKKLYFHLHRALMTRQDILLIGIFIIYLIENNHLHELQIKNVGFDVPDKIINKNKSLVVCNVKFPITFPFTLSEKKNKPPAIPRTEAVAEEIFKLL